MRKLAVRLAGPDDGEDLSQEVSIAALRKRPALGLPLRPWLASVTRKLLHTRRRSVARTLERERRVEDAPPEAMPAEALLERAELLSHIGKLVDGLEEPYRTTVLLRFYEG